jgi:hypothetical protein
MRRIKNVSCGFNAYVKLLCGYPFLTRNCKRTFYGFLVIFEIGITDKYRNCTFFIVFANNNES